jgi:hypothetical protein
MLVYQALGEQRVLDPLMRGMGVFVLAQQGDPQPGWALQYTTDLKPAGARSSEPPSLATHTTYASVAQMIKFYRWTGDTKYLARLDDALDWLDKLELPKARQLNGFTHPTFIEVGTDRALYLKGTGTWAGDMHNEVVYEPRDGVSWVNRKLNVPALRRELQRVRAMPKAEATKDSPLFARSGVPLDRYFVVDDVRGSDLNIGEDTHKPVADLVSGLNAQGYWPTPITAISNVYHPDDEAAKLPATKAANGQMMDARDTSPYTVANPVMGISTGTYINNMSRLIKLVEKV